MTISKTVVDTMIRNWKKTLLNAGEGALGYPKINIIAKWFMPRNKSNSYSVEEGISDADIIQGIVNRMPTEERTAFEAYHLMLIRGQRCRELPHKARAIVLGIDESTYYRRVRRGKIIIRDELEDFL